MIRTASLVFSGIFLGGLSVHGQVTAVVSSIEGAAEVRLPGQDEPVPLEENQALPTGSTILTEPDSEVVLQGTPGSVIKVEEASELSIHELAVEKVPAQPPAPKSVFDLIKGRMAYSFDEFPDGNGPKSRSYFKIKLPMGVMAAKGGSGFADASGNFAAMSGTQEISPTAGGDLRVEAGFGGMFLPNGRPGRLRPLLEMPRGREGSESVLHLAARGRKRNLLRQQELDLVLARARALGFTPERIKAVIERAPRPRRMPVRWQQRQQALRLEKLEQLRQQRLREEEALKKRPGPMRRNGPDNGH